MRRLTVICAALAAGCTVGPNYRPPATAVPAQFAEQAPQAGVSDAALAGWWQMFGDPQLDILVNRAIAQNLDVQTAAPRECAPRYGTAATCR